ncbi:Uncharacterized protein Adt_05213 [Abeliophyllum distichum]|uniref:Integrase catalytic domain-containing protein n=1 Tax=Abeliophyllum distichum TaxID=126358 RepID=A0ABD1V3R3_9LAMI
MIENITGKKIKFLRTDNGLEFGNSEFDKMCVENGITGHKTVPYTPQQNGVAERMNRTLLDKVRGMMISSNVPKLFWGEAVMTACYLINLTPSTALNGGDQQEGDCRQLETIKVSTHIPSTSCEVETQIQQPEEEDEEVVIEDQPVEENPLVDYQLARDRERRQAREPRRFGYESELAFAYASYEELVDREPNTFEEAMKSEQSEEWLKAMREKWVP